MRSVLKKALVTLAVSAALLGAAEVALRRAVPQHGVTPFRNSDVPGLMAGLKPGFETLYVGQRIQVNSSGYRGPEFPEPAAGVARVALVGDSFTFGSAVAFEGTLGAQLEGALLDRGRPAQVLNLGVPGYAAQDAAAVVEHVALGLEPDVVVYVFFCNDIEPQLEYRPIPTENVIDPLFGFPLHSALAQWTATRLKLMALDLGHSLARRTSDDLHAAYAGDGGARVRAALERIRDACAAADIRLVVAVQPFLTRVDLSPFRVVDEMALADARRLGIECVDLLDAYGGENDLTRYWASVFDSHPSAEGHALTAAYLAAHLTR